MRKNHRTEEEKQELIQKIEEANAQGISVKDASTKLGMYSTQYYDWKLKAKKMNGHAREIKVKNNDNEKHLKIENQRLKMIVAEQALDIQALKEWSQR